MPDGSLVWDGLLVDLTERRAAEAALRDSEALKGAILDAALDCVVTTDHESRVVEWNRAAERTFGHARDAALGVDMTDLIVPPELRGAHRRGLARHLATGKGPVLGRRVEVEALRADGSRFPAELAVTPTSAGGRTLFTAHLRDITARRAAEAALRESELRFRSLVEVSPQVVWFSDAGGAVTYCNPYWHDHTGLTPAGTRGDGWTRAVHPDHRGRVLAAWKAGIEAAGPFEVEIPIRRASDGHHRWFLARGEPLRDEATGAVERWIGVAVDIQECKGAEEALRAAHARAEAQAAERAAILGQLAEGVVVTDLAGRITLVNEAAARIHGVARLDVPPEEYSAA
jgi:PAS domain S-box-containing protein